MLTTVSARLTIALTVLMLASPTVAVAQLLRQGSGEAPADIQAAVDAFRIDLGNLNPNVAGSFANGRREINWDGVPDGFAAPNNLPANFFNSNSPRGVVFFTPGSGFQVSADSENPTNTPIEFENLRPGASKKFRTFRPQRLLPPWIAPRWKSSSSSPAHIYPQQPGGSARFSPTWTATTAPRLSISTSTVPF